MYKWKESYKPDKCEKDEICRYTLIKMVKIL